MLNFYKVLAFFCCTLLGWSTLAPANGNTRPVRITVLGDSLSAGYGLTAADAFPAQLERALRDSGYAADIINAGVSGDTTAGGLSRLDWTLADAPDIVIVALGGNDGLRGIDPDTTAENLDRILRRLLKNGVRPLLVGMRAPRNLGEDYYTKFDALFPRLAARYDLAFYPFFLEGVAADPALNLPDGIHPNSEGIREMVRRILPLVQQVIESNGKSGIRPP